MKKKIPILGNWLAGWLVGWIIVFVLFFVFCEINQTLDLFFDENESKTVCMNA